MHTPDDIPGAAPGPGPGQPPAGTGARRFRSFGRRLGGVALSFATTLAGLLLVTFLIGRVVPVDPVLTVVGDHASQATYDKAYKALGLDRPLWEQFLTYASNAVRATSAPRS